MVALFIEIMYNKKHAARSLSFLPQERGSRRRYGNNIEKEALKTVR